MLPLRSSAIRCGCCLIVALLAAGCGGPRTVEPFRIIARYPHDSTAYTQGLLFSHGVLYESTGLYGRSDVRRVALKSGRVLASVPLPADRFGEGLALLRGRLYQLTWKSHVAYIYNVANLALLDSVRYVGQGWGLTTDDTTLIMSDGSDSLRFVAPNTFRTERVVHVRYHGSPVFQLNELEYVRGNVFANVYQTNWVLEIDPRTGRVRRLLNFADLYPESRRPPTADVMNGIAAYHDGELLMTGKLWPVMFLVRLRAPPGVHASG